MKTIRATEILDYYDGIEIFAGRDEIGGSYLGVRNDVSGDHDCYVVVGVRPERLREFRSGVLDLRDLMLDAPGGEWFTVLADMDYGDPMSLVRQETPMEKADILPLSGFTLDDLQIDEESPNHVSWRENHSRSQEPRTSVAPSSRTLADSPVSPRPAPSLRDLPLRYVYDRANCPNLLEDFYIPLLGASVRYDRMTMTFNGRSLSVAAAGIAGLINNGGHMRLICHRELSREVVKAIQDGLITAETAVVMSFGDDSITEIDPDDLQAKHHLDLLTWLVKERRLEIKVAIPNDPDGIFDRIGSCTINWIYD